MFVYTHTCAYTYIYLCIFKYKNYIIFITYFIIPEPSNDAQLRGGYGLNFTPLTMISLEGDMMNYTSNIY